MPDVMDDYLEPWSSSVPGPRRDCAGLIPADGSETLGEGLCSTAETARRANSSRTPGQTGANHEATGQGYDM